MALSDSIETTHSSGIKMRVEWTATQNASNNTSSVTATAKLYYGYTISASAAKAVTLTIDGQSFNWSLVLGTFSGWKTLGSRTVTVSHDAGGAAKSFTLAASCAIQVNLTSGYVGTVSTSGSGTLDALGSAFNFTVPSSVTAGANVNYNATGGDSATRFHLYFKLGSNPEYEIVNRTAGNIGFIVPLGWLPTQTSAAMTVTMRAYKAGALLGTITKTTTVNVASDVKPSVGTLSLSRTGQSTLAQYVQGKNSVTLSIPSASAGDGSTLKNVIFTCGSQSVTRSASTRSYTFSLPSAGTQSVSVKAVDQRGRSTTVSNSIVVRKYAPPRITSAPEVYRCTSAGTAAENGTYARLKVGYALGVTTTDLPGIAYSARTVKWGSTGSANLAASGSWTAAFGAGGFSEESAYTLTVTVKDNLGGQAVQTVSLPSLFVTMDFKAGGRGIAFGKVASEDNLLETQLPFKANAGVEVTGGGSFTGNVSVPKLTATAGIDVTGASVLRTGLTLTGGAVSINSGASDTAVTAGNIRLNGITYLSDSISTSAWEVAEPLFLDGYNRIYRWTNAPRRPTVVFGSVPSGTVIAAGGFYSGSITHSMGGTPRSAIAALWNRPGGSAYLTVRVYGISASGVDFSVYNTGSGSTTLSGTLSIRVTIIW